MSPTTTHAAHDPLDADEIAHAVITVRDDARLASAAWFSMITLDDPPGATDNQTVRRARLVIVNPADADIVEATVDLDGSTVVEWRDVPGVRPAMGFDESIVAMAALHGNEEYLAALARRGITDLTQVQIDPWPTGNFGDPKEDGRRVARCISYYRAKPSDNGYGRPVEGLLAVVDTASGEVLEVVDYGVVPLPEGTGSYLPEDNEPLRPQLSRLDITQPDGPGFTVDGHVIRWQNWSLHAALDPLEGLVLHDVTYDDAGRTRSVLRRASISEMVVPYGDPDPAHGWKSAFDVGEWGLGRMVNSLALGCDCLGEIHYLDATFADEHGRPMTVRNAICIHEEDFGILWKHVDLYTDRAEVRRSRRLVVSSISTLGNYEYGFYWYFYLDGSIQHEVKLTGILSTKALSPDRTDTHASRIAPGLAAPIHQHLFCARLDVAVDGLINEVHEINVVRDLPGDANPWGNAFRAVETRLDHELAAVRDVDPTHSRCWWIVNPDVHNELGEPVAYRLMAGPTPTMLADPDASVAKRAGFARHNLWVTPAVTGERRSAGEYPNQHPGGAGLVDWTRADRSLIGTPIVVWHTFGISHLPRPEDWPVMPVETCGFRLDPVGFFEANPALNVPPPPDHCH